MSFDKTFDHTGGVYFDCIIYIYICTWGQASISRTTISSVVSDCVHTEQSVGPNKHCICLLAPVIIPTSALHIANATRKKWTHLQRGDMRACSSSKVGKPTSHESLHCTMQLFCGKGRTSGLETCACHPNDINRDAEHHT